MIALASLFQVSGLFYVSQFNRPSPIIMIYYFVFFIKWHTNCIDLSWVDCMDKLWIKESNRWLRMPGSWSWRRLDDSGVASWGPSRVGDSPTRRAKMRKKISKVWGKNKKKFIEIWGRNKERRTLAHPGLWGWLRPCWTTNYKFV